MKILEKQDTFILHRWAAELPLMEKPVSYEVYRKQVLGDSSDSNTKEKEKSKEEFDKQIEKIKQLRELDRRR